MVDVAFVGVNTVIDNRYRRKIRLIISGLFLAVSVATAVCTTMCIRVVQETCIQNCSQRS